MVCRGANWSGAGRSAAGRDSPSKRRRGSTLDAARRRNAASAEFDRSCQRRDGNAARPSSDDAGGGGGVSPTLAGAKWVISPVQKIQYDEMFR